MDHKIGKLIENPKRVNCLKISALTTGHMESPMMTSWKTHLDRGKGKINQKGFVKHPNIMT